MPDLASDITSFQGIITYEISKLKFFTNIIKISHNLKLEYVDFPSDFLQREYVKVQMEEMQYLLVNVPKILNLKRFKFTEKSRILFYDYEDIRFFFPVSKINHMMTVDNNFRESVKIVKPSYRSEYVSGAMIIDEVEFLRLDLDKIGKKFWEKV
jgi:hypothetical protein